MRRIKSYERQMRNAEKHRKDRLEKLKTKRKLWEKFEKNRKENLRK